MKNSILYPELFEIFTAHQKTTLYTKHEYRTNQLLKTHALFERKHIRLMAGSGLASNGRSRVTQDFTFQRKSMNFIREFYGQDQCFRQILLNQLSTLEIKCFVNC